MLWRRRILLSGVTAWLLMATSCTKHVTKPVCDQKPWKFVESRTGSAAARLESVLGRRDRREPTVVMPLGFVSRCQFLLSTSEDKVVVVWIEEDWPQETKQVIASRSLTREGEVSAIYRRQLHAELARELMSVCEKLAKLPDSCGVSGRSDTMVGVTGTALGERALIMKSAASELGVRLGLLVLFMTAYTEGRVGNTEVERTVDDVNVVLRSIPRR